MTKKKNKEEHLSYYNNKGYADPTAFNAIRSAEQQESKTSNKVVNQYKDVLESAQYTLTKQAETIQAAIKIRIFNQSVIEFLEQINTAGNLTNTINSMIKLNREFDNLAMNYGPYQKADYIKSVINMHESSLTTATPHTDIQPRPATPRGSSNG